MQYKYICIYVYIHIYICCKYALMSLIYEHTTSSENKLHFDCEEKVE